MSRISNLLDQHYEPRRPRLQARVTSIPTSGLHTLGYVVCNVAGQTGIKVSVSPGAVYHIGDMVSAERIGTRSFASYIAVGFSGGSRPDSGVFEVPADGTQIGEGTGDAGDLVFGDPYQANQFFDYSEGATYYRYGQEVNGADYANGDRDFGPQSALHWHYEAATGILGVFSGETRLRYFDGETGYIVGWEGVGRALGPGIRWGTVYEYDSGGSPVVVDGEQVERYAFRMQGYAGVPVGLLTGTEASPDDYSFFIGDQGATQRLTYENGALAISNGTLSSGATAFLTGTGYWLDYNNGSPRFRIGEIIGGVLNKGISWDGSNIRILSGKLTLDDASSTWSIGGWDITATSLTKNNATLSSTGVLTLGSGDDIITMDATAATWRLSIGNAAMASAPFRVDKDGNLYALSLSQLTSSTGTDKSVNIATSNGTAIYCSSSDASGYGIWAYNNTGAAIFAQSNSGYGIYASSTTDYAGYLVGDVLINGYFEHTGTRIGFYGITPAARPSAMTFTNGSIDRSINCDSTSDAELADVIYTIWSDLKDLGLLQ